MPYSLEAKAGAKAKNRSIKELVKKIKEYAKNIKEIFSFRIRFRSV